MKQTVVRASADTQQRQMNAKLQMYYKYITYNYLTEYGTMIFFLEGTEFKIGQIKMAMIMIQNV